MKLSGSTKIHDLLIAYPFLEDFLAAQSPKFEMLKNRMARATVGRVATLRTAAGIANLDLNTLLHSLAAEIERLTDRSLELEVTEVASQTREQRLRELKEIISQLHEGGDLGEARERFAKAVEDVEASEIATMEEDLIRGGLPVSEVQRLCDVHVGAFRQALDEHAEVDTPPGHPLHTYVAANRMITSLANTLGSLAREVAVWIQLHSRFVHIRYLALRDSAGGYRGCLEVSQDVTDIRQLQGERRLLAWEGTGQPHQG